MYMDYYQHQTRRTQPKATPKEKLSHALFGLASEAGEAAGILQKVYQGHPDPFEDQDTKTHLIKELGDALWMIAEAADAIGVSLSYVASTNLRKLEDRYPDGFDPEKSLHRKDDDV